MKIPKKFGRNANFLVCIEKNRAEGNFFMQQQNFHKILSGKNIFLKKIFFLAPASKNNISLKKYLFFSSSVNETMEHRHSFECGRSKFERSAPKLATLSLLFNYS